MCTVTPITTRLAHRLKQVVFICCEQYVPCMRAIIRMQHQLQVFVLQAQYMDRRVEVDGRAFIIPAASMTVFDTIAIVVMIPIYDGILQPIMKTLRCELSLLQRIGWGFMLAALAMVSAAVVERNRMEAIAAGSNVTVMQQVTPYLLVGASEVLSSIGQIEFFYDQVLPPSVARCSLSTCQYLPGLLRLVSGATSSPRARTTTHRSIPNGCIRTFHRSISARVCIAEQPVSSGQSS
jgi:solute carrier family 15 (peptide/histidine transporter), member 3/4